MPTYWSGNGGNFTFGNFTLPINEWTLESHSRLVENTTSGTSATNFEHVVPDNSWSCVIPWDSTLMPDTTCGMTPGVKGNASFFAGRSGKFYTLTLTSVETLSVKDDEANDIVRVNASGKGGVLTNPT